MSERQSASRLPANPLSKKERQRRVPTQELGEMPVRAASLEKQQANILGISDRCTVKEIADAFAELDKEGAIEQIIQEKTPAS